MKAYVRAVKQRPNKPPKKPRDSSQKVTALVNAHSTLANETLDYQPFYCEENIWKLCDRGVRGASDLSGADAKRSAKSIVSESMVIFISNEIREILLFQQRAGDPSTGIVVWDYHVILAEPVGCDWQVIDLDSRLNRPCPWQIYRDQTFRQLPDELAHWRPRFRVVPAELYHREFSSDRRHMRDANGDWMQPPPKWPPIGTGSNLMQFVDVHSEFFGQVVDLDNLLANPPKQ